MLKTLRKRMTRAIDGTLPGTFRHVESGEG
jgi:hypothetical protein